MLCYWAINYLQKQSAQPPSTASSPEHLQPSKNNQTFEALAVLRLHITRLKSSTLHRPLSIWNLALQVLMPISKVWIQLTALWHSKTATTQSQNLLQTFLTTAKDLRKTYINVNLRSEDRKETIKAIKKPLASHYDALLINRPSDEQAELKATYQAGLAALTAEQQEYAERLLNPAAYLANFDKPFETKGDLSLAQQWTQYHQAEVEQRFTVAKELLQQAWPTKKYEAIKDQVHHWLNAYLHPLLAHYSQAFKINYQSAYQKLYQQIVQHLQLGTTEIFTSAMRQEIQSESTPLKESFASYTDNWLQEWQNLLSNPISLLIIKPTTPSPKATVKIDPPATTQTPNTPPVPSSPPSIATGTFVASCGSPKNSPAGFQQNIPKFIEAYKLEEQNGWNCFDVAVGIKRSDLVQYALEQAENLEFRELLAPEIRQAAIAPTKQYALPATMQTPELQEIINAYQNAHNNPFLLDAYRTCCDAIGRPAGNRPSIDELFQFFENPQNRQKYKTTYDSFNQTYKDIVLSKEQLLNEYSLKLDTYKTYIQTYYGNKGWIDFQQEHSASHSPSMIDIAARMLKRVIVIYLPKEIAGGEKIWREAYRTKNISLDEVINIQFSHSHFVRLLPNPQAIPGTNSLKP